MGSATAGPSPSTPIAVVGMALRVPGATTLSRFWQNLLEGRDCLSRPSADALRRSGIPQEELSHPDFVRARPVLDDIERFDADFFGMSAREAELTDPSQRLFLECAWESLESAGVVPGRSGPVVGVFGGCEGNYRQEVLSRFDAARRDLSVSLPVRIGNSLDFLTTRVSHKLDLTGPSVGLLAACATSLLAVDLAVQSLRRGECEVALAGGATVDVPRLNGYVAAVEGMLSPTGRLRPFDAAADGTIFGSGAGVVALRPLADALAAGNPIHAVLRGSASSNDGHPPGKESFVAPSAEGQVAAILGALRDAGISPDTMAYVEAHGTGTWLGDPIEVAALTEVHRRYSTRRGYCSLGSVKANVGHLRCAAGVASLIKACLALSHGIMPPLANFERPNPRIDFGSSPFFVHGDARPWPAGPVPRRAAVSSFGFGGSNVHVVLEEHRPAPPRPSPRGPHLLVVSGHTDTALGRRIEDLGVHVDQHPALPAADVAHTLQRGRRAFAHRACFLADGERIDPQVLRSRRPLAKGVAPAHAASPIFLFPGQGSQQPRAGRDLYAQEAVFRHLVDECAEALAPAVGLDLRTLLGYTRAAGGHADADELLRSTAHVQPALFVVGYATARLLMSWGVAPAAMLGHSVGELVAACLAGVFSLADGLQLVAARARLMQECAPGSMAAVFLAEHLLTPRLPESLELAAVNAPSISVVSGPTEAITRFCAALEQMNIRTQPIDTSHAFHSRMMDPALPEFTRLVTKLPLSAPRIPVISNATGLPLSADQAVDPAYWAGHIRNPVRFSAGVQHLLSLAAPVFVELGPGATLGDLVRHHDAAARVFPFLSSRSSHRDEATVARAALAGLWCAGVEVDWSPGDREVRRTLLPLPTYPFQRSRHWGAGEGALSDAQKTLYERGFSPAPLPRSAPSEPARPWLLVGGDHRLGSALRERLQAVGASVTTLVPGGGFSRVAPNRFEVRVDSRVDLGAALTACGMAGARVAPRVLHLGAVTGTSGLHNSAEAFEAAARTGFFSLLALVQAAHDQGLCDGLEVLLVADGLAKLDGEPGARFAEKAALLGAARDLPLEIPGLRARVVDIPCQEDGEAPVWLAKALLDEVSAADPPALVCLRREGRFAERLYALPELPESSPRLRDGGVVLITGGTGGLGLLFARALHDLCRARLALTSRWTPPPEETWPERARRDDKIGRALARILDLRAQGAEVLVVEADVADRAQVARALEAARTRFGALHGVIHAAGILHPDPAVEKTPEGAARVFGPKVHGAFHLDELLADEPLDLFLQISSQASQFPTPGQVDYAAANAVLDALAENRRRHCGLSCAIGWGAWQETGLAVTHLRRRLEGTRDGAASHAGGAPDSDFGTLEHPVLRSWARESGGELVYRGLLRRGHWLVDDHLLDGQPLLSGTTVLQLIRTAFVDHSPAPGAVELTRVVFERPVFTGDDGTEIELRFARSGEEEAFTLRSRPQETRDEWQVNSTGYVRRITAGPKSSPSFWPHLRQEFAPTALFGGGHLTGGPRWQWRWTELTHEGRIWKRVALRPEFAPDLEVFDLHPALLDGALYPPIDGEECVPHTYDSIRIFAPLVPEVRSVADHRQLGAAQARDITITDLDGNTLIEVEGYVHRNLAGSRLLQESQARRKTRDDAAGPVPGPCRVVVTELGSLESLRREAFVPREPGPGEVQIEIHAAGLNFRDVLTALGQMPGVGAGPLVPGGECSGVVRAVGAGVRHLAPGDSVVAIARDTLATHTTTLAHRVAVMPGSVDFERAAGIPIVFLTAQHALETLARLAPGERVLIQAAAGGVGLAAIQIARLRGAEIFATAGHPEKRQYLRALGVEHVFDSRSLAFVDEVLTVTRGEGVDVVLNSLAGKFIPASLGLLRSEGRFIEIGKRDLQADTPLGLAPFLRNLTFAAFDLGRLIDERPPAGALMLDALMDRFARGELRPLPTDVVAFESAEIGFRRMAHAEHIGKIVFQVRPDTSLRGAVARAFEKTYGQGVPVDWGLDVFRRILSWSEAPPYVLAMGASVDGVAGLESRPRALARAGRSRDAVATAFRPAETTVERALTALWERILGFSPIGIDDDFFDLGGDSIEAIQMQHAIHREFDRRLRNTEFLADPTIAALAALIGASPRTGPAGLRA